MKCVLTDEYISVAMLALPAILELPASSLPLSERAVLGVAFDFEAFVPLEGAFRVDDLCDLRASAGAQLPASSSISKSAGLLSGSALPCTTEASSGCIALERDVHAAVHRLHPLELSARMRSMVSNTA